MTLHYSLLDEPLIGVRLAADGHRTRLSLPALFVALSEDRVRDFPALRPHQRHPWHAFLVQLAAMAVHRAGRDEPFDDEQRWREALLDLTPEHSDGAAWCLVAPIDRPAFLQAPVPEGSLDRRWSDDTPTPDSLDILVTSKNHDLKQERQTRAEPDDWIFALVSLQTAAPYPGKFNYGVVRMNGGSSSRPGLGVEPRGGPGRRWRRDLRIALDQRPRIIALEYGYRNEGGVGLLWLDPWDGSSKSAYGFTVLDPFFIEISRRLRLVKKDGYLFARRTGSKAPRIAKPEADARGGNTGDLWTPIKHKSGKALSVGASGFGYKRMVDLVFGIEHNWPPAQDLTETDDKEGLTVLARSIAGGNSKTEGYHERRVPISRRVRKRLIAHDTDPLADLAKARVADIAQIRKVLWSALTTLFDNGSTSGSSSEAAQKKASRFTTPFEQGEDARFFDGPLGLNAEIDAEDPDEVHLAWYRSMAERAEAILLDAFEAGPRSAEQRYRARAAALSRLHGGLRSGKVLPALAQDYRNRQTRQEDPMGETSHESA